MIARKILCVPTLILFIYVVGTWFVAKNVIMPLLAPRKSGYDERLVFSEMYGPVKAVLPFVLIVWVVIFVALVLWTLKYWNELNSRDNP